MPTFRILPVDGPSYLLEGESWMDVLSVALERQRAGEDPAECDLVAGGDIDVLTRHARFRIVEVPDDAVPARVALAPRLSQLIDAPDEDTLDAPNPTRSPAWAGVEDRGEDLLLELESRSTTILLAETAEDACSLGLDLLMELLPVESGAVLIAERRSGDLLFVAARGPRSVGLRGARLPAGQGIAGRVAKAGTALKLREVSQDPRHYSAVDKATGYVTRSLLCVPVRGSGLPFGCIELLNPFAGVDFAPWHQTAAQLVAARIAGRVGA